ncbi:MAG: folate hydrolase [Caulobacter sp.]|nr:folate hydrolase [Caulobacter sp.]
MRQFAVVTAIAAALALSAAAVAGAAPKVAPPAMTQAELEKRFDALIDTKDMDGWMKDMASQPNHVGSPHDKANAEYMLAKFKAWGWDAHIETFDVLYPTPISETLEIVGPTPFKATLQEPPIVGDTTEHAMAGALPAWVAFGADGDVTSDLVYVNFGMPDDYKALERLGIDVKGKIVIARYGAGWRGLKPKLAQDHGAIGCIIYSDPAQDGYVQDDAYPNGPARPPHSFQRGSVADMPIYPGDPLTPGYGSTKDAKRIPIAEAKTILKIPVLPISYADAQVFLSQLKGPVAPPSFRGGLPITYHVGPGPAKVHLATKAEWTNKTIYDVVAVMKGSQYPDQWIVRGNHHDGWVYGASDPLSGNVAMMSEMKAIGTLVKQGWRPKRTLVYASWDAEEPMLLGSTEYAETHAVELKAHALIYINTDNNGRGFLGVEGNHDFQRMVNGVANDVIDPEANVSIGQRLRANLMVDAAAPGANGQAQAMGKLAASDRDLPLGPLGSGSDYSAFLQHLGVPAINFGFGGEDSGGGVYHSAYDTYEHYSRFVDPGFVYGGVMAKTAGRMVLRVSESELPTQRFGDFADTVSTYLDEVKGLANSRRDAAEAQERLLKTGAYRLADDPHRPEAAPAFEGRVPFINFAPLDNSVDRLKRSAKAYDAALAAKGGGLSADKVAKLNTMTRDIDQLLLDDVGLPFRPWYRNMVYAPGRFTGYGAKTLPGVREAIEERRYDDAARYVGITAKVLDAYSDRLDQATALINGN